MPELIRAGHGLPTLRIVLDRTAGPDERPDEQAVLQAVIGGQDPQEIFRCATDELGLADRTGSAPEAAFRLPAGAVPAIAGAVAAMDASGVGPGALWLELAVPHGDLHLVPWERLLAPVVGDRPVLRVPYHTLRPRTSTDVFVVVVAATLSRAALPAAVDPAAVVGTYVRSWVSNSRQTARVHVFVRDEAVATVRGLVADLPGVVVHDPAGTANLAGSGTGSTTSPADLATNPWLQWMSTALGGEAVDVAHVLTYGNLTDTGGRLMLSRSPVAGGDRDACLLVGSTPLAGALAQLGAWAVVLSGLPGDPCPAGLRDLADAIAQLRPGASVAHAVPTAGRRTSTPRWPGSSAAVRPSRRCRR